MAGIRLGDNVNILALDRAPCHDLVLDRAPENRKRDENGFLHVDSNNIGKANVCPYYGREIPDGQALGLDADRIYNLYRDPIELAKSVAMWKGVPLLNKHVPVYADAPARETWAGAITGDAEWSAPYVKSSLTVWDGAAIDRIDDRSRVELSPAYAFRADMVPGVTPEGIAFDGKMMDIVPNHVALVEVGRAGPDVVVGDSGVNMKTLKLNTRRGLMATGALFAYARPLLAKDAKPIDLKGTITAGTPKEIAEKFVGLAQPVLAADKKMEVADVTAILDTIIALDAKDCDDPAMDEEEETEEEKAKRLAKDEKDDDEKDDKDKPAMDAAAVQSIVDGAVRAAETATVQRMNAIAEAKEIIEPIYGKVNIAMDSAAAVYKLALDAKQVDTKGVDPSAFKALAQMLVRTAGEKSEGRVVMDAATVRTGKAAVMARCGLTH